MSHAWWVLACCLVVLSPIVAGGAVLVSDGSDGPFHPVASVTLDLPPDGIFHFTTVIIPTGVSVAFRRNVANTPVQLLATGDVEIRGTINVSASQFALGSRIGGPGGRDGGLHGQGAENGRRGAGLAPGQGGVAPKRAGGGGGLGTPGTFAFRFTDPGPGTPGGAVAFPARLTGGSGGGGGAGLLFFGVPLTGGDGGGGGGGIRIATPMTLTVGGQILADGAPGGYSYGIGPGGPGGGGSGGVISLEAQTVVIEATALLRARGGRGGGISTMSIHDPNFDSGAHGGLGYVRITGEIQQVDGTVEARPWPLPASAGTFMCYKARRLVPARFPVLPDVTLEDQFDAVDARTFEVTGTATVCNPEASAGSPIHLRGYGIDELSQPEHARVTGLKATNELGTLFVDTIRPDRLLLPATACFEDLEGPCPSPLPSPDAIAHDVDHFKCYTVRVTARTPPFLRQPIQVTDALGGPRVIELQRPTRLCNPVEKNGEAIKDAARHLMCYSAIAKLPAGAPRRPASIDAVLRDQFMNGRVDSLVENEVCVPSTKEVP